MGKVGLIQGFEKIAAGEVIERPASVVKELVENSLDANAIHITLNIEGAGKNLIQIIDDGTGIEPEDVEVIFQHHYSSKIHSAEELENIETLGFRGEALASIAAVSQIELITRTQDNPVGYRLLLNAGQRESLEQCGAPIGTSLKIKNLFYNLPVRKKFLHSDKVELGHISDIVSRYALAYPQVHFKLIHNDLTLINSAEWVDPNNVQGSEAPEALVSRRAQILPIEAYAQAIQNIYGKRVIEQMIPLDFSEGDFKISGYIGMPEIARSERAAASLFVNKRLVINQKINEIMEECYRDFIMRQKYPFYILMIDLPPNQVDFNVHPTKRMVKFLQEQEFMVKFQGIMQNIIREQFKANRITQNKPMAQANRGKNVSSSPVSMDSWTPASDIIPNPSADTIETCAIDHSPTQKSRSSGAKGVLRKENTLTSLVSKKSNLRTQTRFDLGTNPTPKSALASTLEDSENLPITQLPPLRFLNTVGQVGETYLIFQSDDGIIIVDQHAADERINYERVQKYFAEDLVPIQTLVVPIKLQVAQNEIAFIQEAIPELLQYGFTLEHFGGDVFLIRTIPSFIRVQDHPSLIADMCMEIIHMGKAQSFTDIKREVIQYMACHQSIKAGDEIWNRERVRRLISELDKCENPHNCAHGRPTYIKMSFSELERLFHRKI